VAAEFDYANLGRAAIPQREDDRSKTTIDVDMCLAEAGVPAHQPAGGAAQPALSLSVLSSDQEPPVDLSAVSMPGEDKVDAGARRFADDRGVMGEQYPCLCVVCAVERPVEIVTADGAVIDAKEPDGRGITLDQQIFIL